MEHVLIPIGEIHVPHNWEYVDQIERDAAVITDTDLVGRVALQFDDGSYWRLQSADPAVWVAWRADPNDHNHFADDIIAGTLAVDLQPEYEHVQSSASATWTMNHNLGRKPRITLFLAGGAEFDANVIHTNNNQAVAYLTVARAGTALCTV